MKLLDQYFELQKKVYDYFGYVEYSVVIPLDDAREYFWQCDGVTVRFAKTETELVSQAGDYYVYEVYMVRLLPEWVYEGDEFTMICVDTHSDGNRFLQVFANVNRRETAHT